MEQQIVDVLTSTGAITKLQIIFQSFDNESLLKFKEISPEVSRVRLADGRTYQTVLNQNLKTAIEDDNGIGPDLSKISRA